MNGHGYEISNRLDTIIRKATHETLNEPDGQAVEDFINCIQKDNSGSVIYLATKVIATRVHSTKSNEALLALMLLDECMKQCKADFHAEVGRFRFLNELIKLVSPKYFADRTATDVKQKIIQLLYEWSIKYKEETNFKQAYEMLRTRGVISDIPMSALSVEDKSSNPGILRDEEQSKLLQKLLKSNDPHDLQHANKLIKSMVEQEERRCEENSRHMLEIISALDASRLLSEMLSMANEAGTDDWELINELYSVSKKHHSQLISYMAVASNETLEEIISALEEMNLVFHTYEEIINGIKKNDNNIDSLLDLTGTLSKPNSESSIQTLIEVFGKNNCDGDTIQSVGTSNGESSNITNRNDILLNIASTPSNVCSMNALDTLGNELMRQALQDSEVNTVPTKGNNGKTPSMVVLNCKEEIPKENLIDKIDVDDIICDMAMKENKQIKDDLIIDITQVQPLTTSNIDIFESITVSWDTIRPSHIAPRTVYEEANGLKVDLHFCLDRPSNDVSVVVITSISKSSDPIIEFSIQTIIPKGFKMRLLPPSDTKLAPYNPFIPPSSVTQILLIKSLTNAPTVNFKFLISYSSHNDEVSELVRVDSLPLVYD